MSFSGKGSNSGETLIWNGSAQQWARQSRGFDTTARTPVAGIGSNGEMFLTRFIAPFTGTLTQIGYLNTNQSAGDSYLMGLYSLSLTLLATTAAFVPTVSGWDFRNLVSPLDVIGGTEYWAALKGTNASANFAYNDNTPSNASIARSLVVGAGALPASAVGAPASSRIWLGSIKGSG